MYADTKGFFAMINLESSLDCKIIFNVSKDGIFEDKYAYAYTSYTYVCT
jgi:hypothetical protein